MQSCEGGDRSDAWTGTRAQGFAQARLQRSSERYPAVAFENDLMWRTLLPDIEERRCVMQSLWRGPNRFGCQGVAAWTLPDMERSTLWTMLRTGFGLMRTRFPMSASSRSRFLKDTKRIDKLHQKVLRESHRSHGRWAFLPEARCQRIEGSLFCADSGAF